MIPDDIMYHCGWAAAIFHDGAFLDQAQELVEQQFDIRSQERFTQGAEDAEHEKAGMRPLHDDLDHESRFDSPDIQLRDELLTEVATERTVVDRRYLGGWDFSVETPSHWGVAEAAMGKGFDFV